MYSCLVYLVVCASLMRSVFIEASATDMDEEQRVERRHVISSLNLLVFVLLLILTILTIWLFKHRRLRFIHETGLAIIYGLIVGLLIKYTTSGSSKWWLVKTEMHDTNNGTYEPPPIIRLVVELTNGSESPVIAEKQWEYVLQTLVTSDDNSSGTEVNQQELETTATFDPEVFFNVILPPIIFNAGYHMKRRHFFKNFGAIVTFAFLGTTISSFTVGGLMYGFTRLIYPSFKFTDSLLFGAIISATDPVTVLAIFNDLNVDVDLYALVFGESVLNDAVAIVLAGAVESYTESEATGFDFLTVLKCIGNFIGVFLGAFLLGSGMGCITALLTKYTRIRDFPLLETSLFVLMSYATFLAAEALKLTGIVAVLFCGICQAHYTYNNLSGESKARTKELFELMNFLMENFVFTYIGVSTFTFTKHSWNVGFIFLALLAVIVARACHVYPLSFLLNLGRSHKIPYNFQHMMMFSGLRGAMAFALAIRNTSTVARQMMLSTTLVIVIATVILCGGFTTQVLLWLKIRVGVEEETELQQFDSVRNAGQYRLLPDGDTYRPSTRQSVADQTPAQIPAPSRLKDKARLVRVWYNVDARFVKPLLTNAQPTLLETLPACCLPVARLLTTTEQMIGAGHMEPSNHHTDDGDTECILNDDYPVPELCRSGNDVTAVATIAVPQLVLMDQPDTLSQA